MDAGEQTTPGDWQPTLGEFEKALSKLKTGKAQDLGGWSSELLQHSIRTPYLRDLGHKWIISMAVATNLHARGSELLHATKLVALDKGGRAIATHLCQYHLGETHQLFSYWGLCLAASSRRPRTTVLQRFLCLSLCQVSFAILSVSDCFTVMSFFQVGVGLVSAT